MPNIHAADIGAVSLDNVSSVSSDDVTNILPSAAVDEAPNQDTCNMTNSTDFVIENHNSHYFNKTYFSHNSIRHDFDIGSHHDYKIQDNISDFKIKDNFKIKMDNDGTISDYKIQKFDIGSKFMLNETHPMLKIGNRINKGIVNRLCLNDTCSSCNINQLNKVTKESEFCCCGKDDCHHHDLDECVDNILDTENHTDDDFACLCNFYTPVTVVGDFVFKSRNIDNEEKIRNVLIFNRTQDSNQTDNLTVSGGYCGHLNIDLCTNLTDSAYGIFSQFTYIGLDIASLYSQDLNIKDYNLEYYIFTNPDIIVERADIAIFAKANTIIFKSYINHCMKTFNNSFSTDCQINYVSLNIATFLLTVSLKEYEIDYFYNGQAENLADNSLWSGDDSADAILFVLEDLKKCLV